MMHWIILVSEMTPMGRFELSTTHSLWLCVSTIFATMSSIEVSGVVVAGAKCEHDSQHLHKHPFSVSAQLYEWGVAEASSCTG